MNETEVNRENIHSYLVDYMLNIVGKTRLDTLDVEDWRKEFAWTQEQAEEFHHYALKLIRRVFRCNKRRGEDTLGWFLFNYGLKVKK